MATKRTADNGGEYVEIRVPGNQQSVASTSNGRFFIRVSDETQPLRGDDLTRLMAERGSHNREKERATVEETFARLVDLASSLDAEQRRAVEEGLGENELALFDLLSKDDIAETERERLKQASRDLLAKLRELLATMEQWTRNAQTQAEIESFILDQLYVTLPRPPFSEEETHRAAARVYEFVYQRSATGSFFAAA